MSSCSLKKLKTNTNKCPSSNVLGCVTNDPKLTIENFICLYNLIKIIHTKKLY